MTYQNILEKKSFHFIALFPQNIGFGKLFFYTVEHWKRNSGTKKKNVIFFPSKQLCHFPAQSVWYFSPWGSMHGETNYQVSTSFP